MRRGARLAKTGLLCVLVSVFDRGEDGTLTQKIGTAACVSDTGAGPCADGTALGGAFEVTVSADGTNAYVASNSSGAVAVFDRAADGTLTQKAVPPTDGDPKTQAHTHCPRGLPTPPARDRSGPARLSDDSPVISSFTSGPSRWRRPR